MTLSRRHAESISFRAADEQAACSLRVRRGYQAAVLGAPLPAAADEAARDLLFPRAAPLPPR
ncbi:MAG TPA: hypothetical protein PLI95_20440, partial [Polyangiaceae bacterium]|nr:hypothetical protein [Polyangiaceae bacterium]